MTPPDTNLSTETRRHRGPLVGMALVVIFALVMIFYWVGWGNEQSPTNDQTGAATEQAPSAEGQTPAANGSMNVQVIEPGTSTSVKPTTP